MGLEDYQFTSSKSFGNYKSTDLIKAKKVWFKVKGKDQRSQRIKLWGQRRENCSAGKFYHNGDKSAPFVENLIDKILKE